MFRNSSSPTSFTKIISTSLCILVSISVLTPAFALSGSEGESISERMERVNVLRSRGEFQSAIEILNDIIRDYSESEQVLRYAYNHLVFTYNSMEDRDAALEKARQALERFPDLKGETPDIPPSVDEIYDRLRKEMFGSLDVTQPEKCNVFLLQDSMKVFKGVTPLELPLVRVGTYTLEVTKSGYHDYSRQISIAPDQKYSLDVPLSRERGTTWWLIRILPPTLAGALLAYLLWPEETTAGEPQPLPEPPDPPTR
jgi:tetratricopeptide (TPR) repeat protein